MSSESLIDKLKNLTPQNYWLGRLEVYEIIRQHEAEQPKDVVERVAKAICNAHKGSTWDKYIPEAKAAIAAMGDASTRKDEVVNNVVGNLVASPTNQTLLESAMGQEQVQLDSELNVSMGNTPPLVELPSVTSDTLIDCREAFEHWVSTGGDPDWKSFLERDDKGNYKLSTVKGGWIVWLKLWPQLQHQREISETVTVRSIIDDRPWVAGEGVKFKLRYLEYENAELGCSTGTIDLHDVIVSSPVWEQDEISVVDKWELFHKFLLACKGAQFPADIYDIAFETFQPYLQSPKREIGGWQPIETAPKMTAILLYASGYYIGNFNTTNNLWWLECRGKETSAERNINGFNKPTHWMPLPRSPVSEIEGGKSNG